MTCTSSTHFVVVVFLTRQTRCFIHLNVVVLFYRKRRKRKPFWIFPSILKNQSVLNFMVEEKVINGLCVCACYWCAVSVMCVLFCSVCATAVILLIVVRAICMLWLLCDVSACWLVLFVCSGCCYVCLFVVGVCGNVTGVILCLNFFCFNLIVLIL